MSIQEVALNTPPREYRRIVLCFDGQGEYGFAVCSFPPPSPHGDVTIIPLRLAFDVPKNTNVVKMYSILMKNTKDQLCYYQPGLGTRFSPTIVRLPFREFLDKAFACSLSEHVIAGYTFLVENHNPGDKIFMFGFSRGAYVAQALAGMLHKVGLLPREKGELIPSAYKRYMSTSSGSEVDAKKFKESCSPDVNVTIEFIGLWDSVSSVGNIMARTLPSVEEVNTETRVFRQALSLDEHRAKFRPILYTPSNQFSDTYQKAIQPGTDAPEKPLVQVKEVWFPGSHYDVGGGGKPATEKEDLSNISFIWMIEQIMQAECGILFNSNSFDRWNIPSEIGKRRDSLPRDGEVPTGKDAHRQRFYELKKATDDVMKMTDKLNLRKTPWWWIFEMFPTSYSHRNTKGNWVTSWWPHFGRGRSVPPGALFHPSVKKFLDDPEAKYKPRAHYRRDTVRYV